MVNFQTKKRIYWIPRLKSSLFLCLGVVILGGCSHQTLQTTSSTSKPTLTSKQPCSDNSTNKKPDGNHCPPAQSKRWHTKVATNTPAQRPLAIGRPSENKIETHKERRSIASGFITSISTVTPKASHPTSVASPPSYRDLASIIRHTLRDNPDIGIALAQERDERTSIEIARAALHPTVSVRAAYGPENFETDTGTSMAVPRHEFGIDLHQTIYDFGRAQNNIARRKALYNSAGYRRIDKMNKITLEVSSAFLSTLEASQHIIIAQQNVSSHQEILKLVTESQKAGNATVADVKRVTTRLEKAKTNMIDLRSRKQNAREEFIRITGLRPQSLTPPPWLDAPLPPKGISTDKYPDSPGLLSVRADIDSLRAQAKTAKANFEPTIDLDISGNVKNNVAGETGMTSGFKSMLSFNYKILDGDARLNTAHQIQIRIVENKHRYRKKRRDYVHSLKNAIRTVRANLEKSSLLATRSKDSKKVLSLYKAQFKDGSKTVFELLDAQMDLFTTNSEKIANHYGKLRSIYEIYSLRGDLVGRLLR